MDMVMTRLRVIHALIIRDMMVRYGRGHLGFVWTVLEPMILTSGVMLVWTLIKGPTTHGVSVVTFVLTGYMPLTLWRHMTLNAPRLLRRNASLLCHWPIVHSDFLLARLTLEFLSTTAALCIVYFVVFTAGLVDPVADIGLALAGWLSVALYFGGMSMLFAAVSEVWEPAEKFIQPAMYVMLPISGVFFMADWLPDSLQPLLLLNPSVHCMEMFRAGVVGEDLVTHYDPWYLAATTALMLVAGAGALVRVRDRIQVD